MTKRKSNIIYIGIKHPNGTTFGVGEQMIGSYTKIIHLAKFLGVHSNTVSRWIRNNDLYHKDRSIIITNLNYVKKANGETEDTS